jgi:hypothetical protein
VAPKVSPDVPTNTQAGQQNQNAQQAGSSTSSQEQSSATGGTSEQPKY